MELTHERLVDFTAGEIEAVHRRRKACRLELIGGRTDFPFRGLCLDPQTVRSVAPALLTPASAVEAQVFADGVAG